MSSTATASQAKLDELLEAIRQEFNHVSQEANSYRLQNQKDYDYKINQHLGELRQIRNTVYELELSHRKLKESYQEEINRLKMEIAQKDHQIASLFQQQQIAQQQQQQQQQHMPQPQIAQLTEPVVDSSTSPLNRGLAVSNTHVSPQTGKVATPGSVQTQAAGPTLAPLINALGSQLQPVNTTSSSPGQQLQPVQAGKDASERPQLETRAAPQILAPGVSQPQAQVAVPASQPVVTQSLPPTGTIPQGNIQQVTAGAANGVNPVGAQPLGQQVPQTAVSAAAPVGGMGSQPATVPTAPVASTTAATTAAGTPGNIQTPVPSKAEIPVVSNPTPILASPGTTATASTVPATATNTTTPAAAPAQIPTPAPAAVTTSPAVTAVTPLVAPTSTIPAANVATTATTAAPQVAASSPTGTTTTTTTTATGVTGTTGATTPASTVPATGGSPAPAVTSTATTATATTSAATPPATTTPAASTAVTTTEQTKRQVKTEESNDNNLQNNNHYLVAYDQRASQLKPIPPFLLDLESQQVPDNLKKQGKDYYILYNPALPNNLNVELHASLDHSSVVCCVKFSNDGEYLATGCNKTTQVYKVSTGELVAKLSDDNSSGGLAGINGGADTGGSSSSADLYIRSVCFSPDGKFLATGAEDRLIRIWDIAQKKIVMVLQGHDQDVYSLDYFPSGDKLVSGSGDRTVRIWDLKTGQCSLTLSIEDGVTTVAVSPGDSKYIAAGSLDCAVRVWDSETGFLVERLDSENELGTGHKNSVYSVVFTRDGNKVVSGSLDRTVKLWNLHGTNDTAGGNAASGSATGHGKTNNGVCEVTYVGHKDFVLSVTTTANDEYILSGSKDRGVLFWDTVSGNPLLMLQGHRNSVISVAVANGHPLGYQHQVFATGSGDCRARIWKFSKVNPAENSNKIKEV